MKTIYTALLAVAYILITNAPTQAQGCVAVRHMSCSAPGTANSADFFKQRTGHWQVSAGYRYFRSFRHYKGDVEQHERLEQNTEVINISHALDLGITYMPSIRWSVSVNLPIQYNDRSSLYEHYGNSLTANRPKSDSIRVRRGLVIYGFRGATGWSTRPSYLKLTCRLG